MHNLAGTWKSVDNRTLNIKNDGGTYIIKQDEDKITVYGSCIGKFKNFGFAELNDSDEFTITWADMHDSNGKNTDRCVYKVRIVQTDSKTETIAILNGGAMAFGTWKKISGETETSLADFYSMESK